MSDATLARQANLRLTRRIMLDGQERSPADLAKDAHLSVATCNSILRELAASGELLSDVRQTNAVGRRTCFFRLNPHYGHVLFLLCLPKGDGYAVHVSVRHQHADSECLAREIPMESLRPELLLSLIERAAETYPDLKAALVAYPHELSDTFIPFPWPRDVVPVFAAEIASYVAYEHYVRTQVGIATFIVCRDEQRVLVFHSQLGSVIWAVGLPFDEMLSALPGFLRLYIPGTIVVNGSAEQFSRVRSIYSQAVPSTADSNRQLFFDMSTMWTRLKLQMLE